MLQINTQPFGSDALEDAMRLAQTKAINSYSFSDCMNYLNYAWADIYQRVAQMDPGYYSKTVRLTQRLTRLPPFVKNSILVYAAQRPVEYNREIFRASGYNDLQGPSTYHISGFDMYCPDALRRTVWLNYIPMAPMIFFTRNNRDPKLYPTYDRNTSLVYNLYNLVIIQQPQETYALKHRNAILTEETYDITNTILFKSADWMVTYISCDFPYIFVTYKNIYTNEYYSGFFKDILNNSEFIEYNPFAFTGLNSNVEYLYCKHNDKTGMGVVIKDYNDLDEYNQPRIKELGWTPDTMLIYPAPEMYRLLVARLADKFSAFNESNVMGVQKELVEAQYAFDNFLKKDKSAWSRINNVNGPYMSDWI